MTPEHDRSNCSDVTPQPARVRAGWGGRRANTGGARPGAGRPRTVIHLRLPPYVRQQYEEVAAAQGVSVEAVIHDVLLDWQEQWQDEHDAADAAIAKSAE